MSAFVARTRPSLEPHVAAGRSNVMDVLFFASWIWARRNAGSRILDPVPTWPSDACRLLLALAVIAAIVGLLGHAANTGPDARVASIIVPSHSGAPK
jgi:hypothetical protein